MKINERLNNDPFLVGELKASQGDLLSLCSRFERTLKREIEKMSGIKVSATVQGISRLLDHWKPLHQEVVKENLVHMELLDSVLSELAEIVEVRNRICHGQTGLEGSRDGIASETWILTDLNGSERKITLTELKLIAKRLNAIDSHLGRFTYAARQQNYANLDDLYTDMRRCMLS